MRRHTIIASRRERPKPSNRIQSRTGRLAETRRERLAALLKDAPAIENGLTLPKGPPRCVALEQSAFGDILWAYFDDLMTGIIQQLEQSDTSFVDRIRVHDLDTGLIYAPKWTIDSLCEVPD